MNKKQAQTIYKEYSQKLNAYRLVISTAMYDKETIAPIKGNNYRNNKLSIIYGEAFKLQTDPKYIEAVQFLSKLDLGFETNRKVALSLKELESVIKFTPEEAMEFELICMNAKDAWLKAKKASNYKIFEPHLQKLIDASIERAKKRNNSITPYDLYLNDFEDGMSIKTYDKFFSLIKKELLPLIQKINNTKDKIDDSFLYKYYPKDKQEIFIEELKKYLHFDSSWGYMGISEHPFTNAMSQNDVRITTAYNEYNITSSIFSVIHECGHAYYEHDLPSKYEDTSLLNLSMGMHESQSRFFENYLGRRKSFWVNLYPKLQKLFPENLKDVTLDEFEKAINVSKCSLIRTDADELTYPIHILIRYEIEKDIFLGKISNTNLDKVWNKKYKEYLGIKVPSDKEGILQDMHWSDGTFGYFPTYALGSAIGAQILNHMNKSIDIDNLLENNKFSTITKYLQNNIHKYGALYNYNQILKNITNENFNPKYYITYLKNKYKKLYNIK